MRLFGYLLIACMSFGVTAQAGLTLSEDHLHVAHPHSSQAHADAGSEVEAKDHDHDHDYDHADVSPTEYEHRHSPEGPIHQHKNESVAVSSTPAVLAAPISVAIVRQPLRSAAYPSAPPLLTSLEVCPPKRPPRA